MKYFEHLPQAQDYDWILGIDECGTGAWAGPIYVSGACLPVHWEDARFTDSKKLTPKKREALVKLRSELPLQHLTTVIQSAREVDVLGLAKAWTFCVEQLIETAPKNTLIVVDGVRAPKGSIALPKADLLIPAVSVASIFNKVSRDSYMVSMEDKYPGYGFAKTKGYYSVMQKEKILASGASPIHRMSYKPVRELDQQYIRAQEADYLKRVKDGLY